MAHTSFADDDPLAPIALETTVPTALWVVEPVLRAQLLALYAWVRGVDDITDDPLLAGIKKRDQLRTMRAVLSEDGDVRSLPAWARGLAMLIHRHHCSFRHALDVLAALEEDTDHRPMRDYEALLSYAQLVAVPIGRMALEIAEESTADLIAADALSVALQLLNVVRDSGKDYLVLGRVYLPGEWIRQAGMDTDELTFSHSTPRVRTVHGRVLERAKAFLDAARPLPDSIANRRLRIVLRAMLMAAGMLHAALLEHDPLTQRVRLTRWQEIQCLWCAMLDEFVPSRMIKRRTAKV
jgi:phytoene/squalene synthetase